MRSSIVVGFVFLVSGCAVIRHLDDYSIADSTGDVPGAGDSAAIHASDAGAGCTTHSACTAAAEAGATAICVKATGACVALTTTECPRVVGDPMDDDAVFLGTIVGGEEREKAALLAAEELRSAPAGFPHLVVLGCNAGQDPLVPARHLVDDLHVSAVLGPSRAEDVVAVTQQVSARGGTLLMTGSPVGSLTNLADEDLTWRNVASDPQRAKLVIEQMSELETLLRATRGLTAVKLGIVHTNDALGTSARDAISGKLILNGHFILDTANAAFVSVNAYAPADAAAPAAIVTAYARTFRPDIVLVTSAEQVGSIMIPLEQSLAAARVTDRPYYVLTEAARTGDLLARIDSGALPADIRRRIRGVGPVSETASASAYADFAAAFSARYGAAPAVSSSSAYDAMYALAYALAVSTDLPPGGARIAHGLRSLSVGAAASVGSKAIGDVARQLAAAQPVSLRGTFGPLQWDESGDLRGGTLEVWCVGSRDGAATYGSSGMTMDVQTQVVGGAYVQCQ